MSKIIKLEALIAWPPTSKCKEAVGILEEVVRRYPDEVRLVVFKRGMQDFPEKPSAIMMTLIHKSSTVPACIVDGQLFSTSDIPDLEKLDLKVQEVLDNSTK